MLYAVAIAVKVACTASWAGAAALKEAGEEVQQGHHGVIVPQPGLGVISPLGLGLVGLWHFI